MMRSLFSGVSGLRIHQTKMDVIGNNISNINTVGFKRSTTTFNDVINQNLSGATAPSENTGKGGTNAMQIGLGSNVSAISTVMTTGSAERTDNPNDVMISGDGFFIVSDTTGYYFTRAGAFQVDDMGNLTDSNGMRVCGWPADSEGKVVKGKVEPLNITGGTNAYMEATPTNRVTFSGNLNPDLSPKLNTVAFFDSIGNRYVVNATSTYDKDKQTWEVKLDKEATVNGNEKNKVMLDFKDQDSITLTFDDHGLLKPAENPDPDNPGSGFQIVTDVEVNETDTSEDSITYNSKFEKITIDFNSLTGFAGESKSDATAVTDNGNYAGALKGYSIGSDGTVTGTYTNGETKTLGMIAVADFPNPSGLEKVGNNLYAATTNSGDFDGIGSEIGESGGSFIGGSLEMSNVDISYEFTQMITTQRGFQANSRIITTSDEMLQELVNLKR